MNSRRRLAIEIQLMAVRMGEAACKQVVAINIIGVGDMEERLEKLEARIMKADKPDTAALMEYLRLQRKLFMRDHYRLVHA